MTCGVCGSPGRPFAWRIGVRIQEPLCRVCSEWSEQIVYDYEYRKLIANG